MDKNEIIRTYFEKANISYYYGSLEGLCAAISKMSCAKIFPCDLVEFFLQNHSAKITLHIC